MSNTHEFTHRRFNPLNGEWVLVSPHRNNRPWSGASEKPAERALTKYVADCPLCANNTRANGETNPDYPFTHVFKNDFAALTQDLGNVDCLESDELFKAEKATGEARVICFSPDHSKTLAHMSEAEIEEVVKTWVAQYIELAASYTCIHIFENKGEMMGCSQPHPHGQVWAHNHYSSEIEKAEHFQKAYFEKNARALLSDYCEREIKDKSRVIYENEHWLVLVPYWAKWPFETLVLTKDKYARLSELSSASQKSLSQAISTLTVAYDNVFKCSFPYSMGWHNAPEDIDNPEHWRVHAHFYPPLLRSASVKKHMVGYEMLAESQRDLTAETAAQILRDACGTHYEYSI